MGPNITFQLGDDSYAVSRQIAHPTDDLAILELADEIEHVSPRDVLEKPSFVGETLTLVGYGNHGTTNDPQAGFGTLREGHTELQYVENELIGWTFDGDGESSHSLGDSGGPAFVERGGELVIAGVASFITGSPNSPGTQGWDVRADAFSTWIKRTTKADHLVLAAADFDVDGDVDGADFLVWQVSFGVNSNGDADQDGDTDGDDFLIWQYQFGTTGGDGSDTFQGGLPTGTRTDFLSSKSPSSGRAGTDPPIVTVAAELDRIEPISAWHAHVCRFLHRSFGQVTNDAAPWHPISPTCTLQPNRRRRSARSNFHRSKRLDAEQGCWSVDGTWPCSARQEPHPPR